MLRPCWTPISCHFSGSSNAMMSCTGNTPVLTVVMMKGEDQWVNIWVNVMEEGRMLRGRILL